MEKTITTAREAMLLDTSDAANFRMVVRRAVARALENQSGHWRSDDHRDACDVAEAACHFLMDEIKQGLESAERAREYAKSLDINAYWTTPTPTH